MNFNKNDIIDRLADVIKEDPEILRSKPDFLAASIRRCSQDLSTYKNQEIAGEALIWQIVDRCPTFSDYFYFYNSMFNEFVKKFFEDNFEELNKFVEDNIRLNFVGRDYFSASTLIGNYLIKPSMEASPLETPLCMFLRVAAQLRAPSIEEVKSVAIDMANSKYIPSSPTLFNSGLKKHQLSSCFLLPIQDRLDDILYTGIGDAGMISSLGGGLGIGMTNIRHSQIGDFGQSNGIVPFAKVVDKMVEFANQSGKRKGAGTAFLSIWHYDVRDFIKAKDNFATNAELRFTSLNTCLWTNDLFFDRVRNKQKWTLFCPAKAHKLVGLYGHSFKEVYESYEEMSIISQREIDEATKELKNLSSKLDTSQEKQEYCSAVKRLNEAKRNHITNVVVDAATLLNLIIDLQIKSSMPYLCHGDSINTKSNHMNIAPINSSNLCLEIMEATPKDELGQEQIASCNLASLSLGSYVNIDSSGKPYFDYDDLANKTSNCIVNLNSVIDRNYYPLDSNRTYNEDGTINGHKGKISGLNQKSRPVGLGCSGLADAVQQLKIHPGSDEEIELNKMIFACIYFNALCSSVELSILHGEYHYFRTGESEVGGKTYKGSPLSNGFLQFDLWQQEADLLESVGRLNNNYNKNDNVPVDPLEWNQRKIELSNGSFIEPSWSSLREAIKKYGVRNSLLVALMPTASSAQVLRNAESTEYHQSNLYTRNVQSGHFTVMNRWLVRDLEELGVWSENLAQFLIMSRGKLTHLETYCKDHYDQFAGKNNLSREEFMDKIYELTKIYKTQFEISQKHMIKMERQRGIYVDQSQSFNIFFEDPTVQKIRASHIYSNNIGNKVGMYYLRADAPTGNGKWGLKEDVKAYYDKITGSNYEHDKIVVEREDICTSCQ